MKGNLRKREETLRVMMPPEVDHYFVNSIREEVDRKLQTEEIQLLEFDFQKTEFMDSSGIGIIAGRYKKVQCFGGNVYILNAGKQVNRILMLSGIQKYVVFMKD